MCRWWLWSKTARRSIYHNPIASSISPPPLPTASSCIRQTTLAAALSHGRVLSRASRCACRVEVEEWWRGGGAVETEADRVADQQIGGVCSMHVPHTPRSVRPKWRQRLPTQRARTEGGRSASGGTSTPLPAVSLAVDAGDAGDVATATAITDRRKNGARQPSNCNSDFVVAPLIPVISSAFMAPPNRGRACRGDESRGGQAHRLMHCSQ